MRFESNRRGNALLVALIALAVLMVLVVGAIRFTGANREAAVSKARGDQLASCAEAGRRYILSRLRTFNVQVTGLSVNEALPDDQKASAQSRMLTGHYADTTPAATIVSISPASMSAARKQVTDTANRNAKNPLGGQYYRVVVKCRDPGSGAETELEFSFRHGV